MNENLTKTCRICLTEGSRNIFQRTVAHDALYNVSSLNRISEKLRYVTLLKIDEMENLPPMICDLCIVQLNVAYNFKRQATESDTKLRQYLIENGIDIMKDPLAVMPVRATIAAPPPATNPPASILRPAIVAAASRTIQRRDSTASSAVLEIPTAVRPAPHGAVQLRPIRIKVETPETTTEQSSEGGDLLSNSEISPVAASAVDPSKTVTVDSSPASSKTSSSERGAMVVVSSENVSLQGDEDFVQNILGSNSSIATSSNGRVAEQDKPTTEQKKDDPPTGENKKKDRMKALMSKLSINMVNSAKFPKSKHRTKPRKQRGARMANGKVAPASDDQSPDGKRRRHSLDVSLLQAKRSKVNGAPASEERRRNPVARQSANVISANKLRSLREKIREEKESGGKKVADADAKRRKTFALVSLDSAGATSNGDGPSRTSLP